MKLCLGKYTLLVGCFVVLTTGCAPSELRSPCPQFGKRCQQWSLPQISVPDESHLRLEDNHHGT